MDKLKLKNRLVGFTLIEVVITIMVVSVIASIGSLVIVQGMKAYYAIDAALPTLAKLRYSINRIAQELRETDYDGTDYLLTVTYPSTANGSITFTKLDGTEVTIDGSTSTMTMRYGSGGTYYTLTNQLSDLTFNFYQYDGTTAATANTDVRFIEINLTLSVNGNTSTQRTMIGLRDPD